MIAILHEYLHMAWFLKLFPLFVFHFSSENREEQLKNKSRVTKVVGFHARTWLGLDKS